MPLALLGFPLQSFPLENSTSFSSILVSAAENSFTFARRLRSTQMLARDH
jgi:hypothetical protein